MGKHRVETTQSDTIIRRETSSGQVKKGFISREERTVRMFYRIGDMGKHFGEDRSENTENGERRPITRCRRPLFTFYTVPFIRPRPVRRPATGRGIFGGTLLKSG